MAGDAFTSNLLPALEDFYQKHPFLEERAVKFKDRITLPRTDLLKLRQAHAAQIDEIRRLKTQVEASPVKQLHRRKQALSKVLERANNRLAVQMNLLSQQQQLVKTKVSHLFNLRSEHSGLEKAAQDFTDTIRFVQRSIIKDGNDRNERELGAVMLIEFRCVGLKGEDILQFLSVEALIRSAVRGVLAMPPTGSDVCCYRQHQSDILVVSVFFRLPERVRTSGYQLRRLRQLIWKVVRTGEFRIEVERRVKPVLEIEVVEVLRPHLMDGVVAPVPKTFVVGNGVFGMETEDPIPNRMLLTSVRTAGWAHLIGFRVGDIILFGNDTPVYAGTRIELRELLWSRPVEIYAGRFNPKATHDWDQDAAAFVIQLQARATKLAQASETTNMEHAMQGFKLEGVSFHWAPEGLGDPGFTTEGEPPGRVFIATVEEDSWAEAAHLHPGDEIVTLNGASVLDVEAGEFDAFMKYTRPLEIGVVPNTEDEDRPEQSSTWRRGQLVEALIKHGRLDEKPPERKPSTTPAPPHDEASPPKEAKRSPEQGVVHPPKKQTRVKYAVDQPLVGGLTGTGMQRSKSWAAKVLAAHQHPAPSSPHSSRVRPESEDGSINEDDEAAQADYTEEEEEIVDSREGTAESDMSPPSETGSNHGAKAKAKAKAFFGGRAEAKPKAGEPDDAIVASDVFTVSVSSTDQALGIRIGALPPEPVYVQAVPPNTVAHNAGVLPGDRLIAVNGKDVATMSPKDLQTALKTTRPLRLTFARETTAAQISGASEVQAFFRGKSGRQPAADRHAATKALSRLLTAEEKRAQMQVRPSVVDGGASGSSGYTPEPFLGSTQAASAAASRQHVAPKDAAEFIGPSVPPAPPPLVTAADPGKLWQAIRADQKAGLVYEVVAGTNVGRLGFKPRGMPPDRMFVQDLEAGGWAVKQGVQINHELIVVEKSPVALMSRQELVNSMPQRPLHLLFRGERGLIGGVGGSARRPGARPAPVVDDGEVADADAAARAEAFAEAVAAGDRVPRPLSPGVVSSLQTTRLGRMRFDVVAEEDVDDLGFLPSGFPPDEVHVEKVWGFASENLVSVGDRLVGVNGVEVAAIERKHFKAMMRETRPLRMTFEFVLSPSKDKQVVYASDSDAGEGFFTNGKIPFFVTRVIPGSWAAIQGLQMYDRLETIGGQPASSLRDDEIFSLLRLRPMRFVFARQTHRATNGLKKLKLVLHEKDINVGFAISSPPDVVVVTKVKKESWAEVHSIKAGMVLAKINGKNPATLTLERLQAELRSRPLSLEFDKARGAEKNKDDEGFIGWAYKESQGAYNSMFG